MDSRRDQNTFGVTGHESEGAARLEDTVDRVLSTLDDVLSPFDEDTYLRAFPDVEKAVSGGLYKSALQHYIEHGQREDRLSQAGYIHALNRRSIEGQIDFCGHASVPGGWIFCGWTSERWDATSSVRIVAHFRDGDIAGESISAFPPPQRP
jgi:hypothetical protein